MGRFGTLRLAGAAALWATAVMGGGGHTSAAPVPKAEPRAGVILVVSGYGSPARLLDTNGAAVGELPFDSVYSCALSPGGTHVAAVVRTGQQGELALYVVRLAPEIGATGEPLARDLKYPVVAWGADGKLYVSELVEPPVRANATVLGPGGVTVFDLERKVAAAPKALQGHLVSDVSPDGKRLLASRFVADPAPRWEPELLDAATGKRADVGAPDGVSFARFLGAGELLGSRPKKGAPNETEYVTFDLAAKRVSPVPVPAEVVGGAARVFRVLPAPDGKRLLFLWTEAVPAPEGWPGGARLEAARMTIGDRDGRNARTIFKPVIRTRADETRNHIGATVDWR